jgi:uncharacterized membrane protein YebE (DUF533 family)
MAEQGPLDPDVREFLQALAVYLDPTDLGVGVALAERAVAVHVAAKVLVEHHGRTGRRRLRVLAKQFRDMSSGQHRRDQGQQ